MPKDNLVSLYGDPEVNRISGFAEFANSLDVDALCAAYHDLISNAPKRHLIGKQYFQFGHDGFPSGKSSSNRREEHLALALFNSKTEFEIPGNQSLKIIDYQTPLKSRQSDQGIGKVDLFGVIDKSVPTVIELKIMGVKGRTADTPLRALLEGLAYCALVEANIDDIAGEAFTRFNLPFSQSRPDLIVMAPDDYWQSYLSKLSAGDWLPILQSKIAVICEKLSLSIHLVSLINLDFNMGSNNTRPMLANQCRIVPVNTEMSGS